MISNKDYGLSKHRTYSHDDFSPAKLGDIKLLVFHINKLEKRIIELEKLLPTMQADLELSDFKDGILTGLNTSSSSIKDEEASKDKIEEPIKENIQQEVKQEVPIEEKVSETPQVVPTESIELPKESADIPSEEPVKETIVEVSTESIETSNNESATVVVPKVSKTSKTN